MTGIGSMVSDTPNLMPADHNAVPGLLSTQHSDGNVEAGGDMHQTNSESDHDFGRDGTFPDHPKVGPWFALSGEMMEPWEMIVLESVAEGDTRHQDLALSPAWDSTVIVQTGMTHGVGENAGPTDIPNHSSEG